jgi:hypothetical protein
MMKTRTIWVDGQASVMWLTGTHTDRSVGIPADQVEERERIASDYAAMCHLAADRLEQTLWFGILEDLDRSMELLQYALKLDFRPKLPKSNRGPKQPPATEWEKKALESLMPQDMWLYEYAKRLFEARWMAYKTGNPVTLPERPPLPKLTCVSTREQLNCTSGPFAETGPLYVTKKDGLSEISL